MLVMPSEKDGKSRKSLSLPIEAFNVPLYEIILLFFFFSYFIYLLDAFLRHSSLLNNITTIKKCSRIPRGGEKTNLEM